MRRFKIFSLLLAVALLFSAAAVLSSCGAKQINVTVTVTNGDGVNFFNEQPGTVEATTVRGALEELGYIPKSEQADAPITKVNVAGGGNAAEVTVKVNGAVANAGDAIAEGAKIEIVCKAASTRKVEIVIVDLKGVEHFKGVTKDVEGKLLGDVLEEIGYATVSGDKITGVHADIPDQENIKKYRIYVNGAAVTTTLDHVLSDGDLVLITCSRN